MQELVKVKQLTSSFGIYQHGDLGRPDPKFGYALEDQARALLVAEEFSEKELADIYFNFLINSLGENGKIYQFFYDKDGGISPDKERECSDDALGMTAWALLKTKKEHSNKEKIVELIYKKIEKSEHLRASAYLLLGLTDKSNSQLEDKLIKKILTAYRESGGWKWFEDCLVYGNALLPWALWKRGRIRKDKESLGIAEKTTHFLLEKCQDKGLPLPIGCNGWHAKGGIINKYDQQPVDVAYMICCLEEAYLATNDKYYLDQATNWWGWFWGKNTRGVRVIDENGACFDAVTEKEEKVNLNQGAESNICFLMAYLTAKRLGLAK